MKKTLVVARKSFVLATIACSLLFAGSSPKKVAASTADCQTSGSPCVPLNCSYWQCNIDRTYYSASPSTRCSAVMQTYNGMLYNCPAIAQCNINLYGCR